MRGERTLAHVRKYSPSIFGAKPFLRGQKIVQLQHEVFQNRRTSSVKHHFANLHAHLPGLWLALEWLAQKLSANRQKKPV